MKCLEGKGDWRKKKQGVVEWGKQRGVREGVRKRGKGDVWDWGRCGEQLEQILPNNNLHANISTCVSVLQHIHSFYSWLYHIFYFSIWNHMWIWDCQDNICIKYRHNNAIWHYRHIEPVGYSTHILDIHTVQLYMHVCDIWRSSFTALIRRKQT